MIAENATKSIEQAVCYELQNIVKVHGPSYHSWHEGYAILKEESEEACEDVMSLKNHLEIDLWNSIRKNAGEHDIKQELHFIKEFALALAEEAVQCAAVCEKFMGGLKNDASAED